MRKNVKQKKEEEKINKLNFATLNFFPLTGFWDLEILDNKEELTEDNFACNLNNNYWLAQMFHKNEELFSIPFSEILNYVTNSTFFANHKHEYALKIVKWQIMWLMNGGSNYLKIYSDSIVKAFLNSSECDLYFRWWIIETLKQLDLPVEIIQEGLEKNAYLWRNQVMEKTFFNIYKYNTKELQMNKEKWLCLRQYKYYQNNQEWVDKYGKKEGGMLIPQEEIKKRILEKRK